MSKEIFDREEALRALQNQFTELMAVQTWIEEVVDGKEVCDFALSFPIVRKIVDLVARAKDKEESPRESVSNY